MTTDDPAGAAVASTPSRDRKPILCQPPTLRSQIRREQVSHFITLARELIAAEARCKTEDFCDLPEYGRFISGAYACGFVCADGPTKARYFQLFAAEPRRLANATFLAIRRLVHFMMRAERHADAGGPDGGGWIRSAVRSGCLEAVAQRLEGADEWRQY